MEIYLKMIRMVIFVGYLPTALVFGTAQSSVDNVPFGGYTKADCPFHSLAKC
jgi:hypothetical protein